MSTWVTKQIGSLFHNTTVGEWGTSPTPQSSIPVLRSTNITNDGKIDTKDIVVRNVPPDKLQSKQVSRGDILVEKSGGGPQQPAGRVAFCDFDFGGTCSNFIEIARVSSDHDSRFVFYLLYYLYQSGLVLKYQQQTTGIINFKFREYQTETVRIPASKTEQTAIADILTTVDQAIEQTEALIAKQRRIKAGLLHDLLTRGIDEHGRLRDRNQSKVPLIEIAEINPPRTTLRVDASDPVSFIPMSDVSESARWTNKQMRRFGEVMRGYTCFQEDDVLMAKITPCAENGKGCLARGLVNGIGYGSTEFHVLRARENADADFIFQVSTYKALRDQAASQMTGSAGQQRVPESFLASYMVSGFSKDEQVRIAAVLRAADDHLINEEENLGKLHRLKTGLMQDLLSGRVSVAGLARQEMRA